MRHYVVLVPYLYKRSSERISGIRYVATSICIQLLMIDPYWLFISIP